jgi:hypothetical protein
VRSYATEQFVSRGMVADVALHFNPGNPHAHIMLTMREMGLEGLSPKKNREWNKPEWLLQWREEWAAHANRALERSGREERIDHRSLAEQGSDRLPQVHLGPHAAALERRGVATEKGEHNRLVAEQNAVVIDLEQVRAEKRRLQAEKAVMDRYGARLQVGWLPFQAQDLGKLEYHLGGAELERSQVVELRTGYQQELWRVQEQVQAVQGEGTRLYRAEELLGQRRQVIERVERLRARWSPSSGGSVPMPEASTRRPRSSTCRCSTRGSSRPARPRRRNCSCSGSGGRRSRRRCRPCKSRAPAWTSRSSRPTRSWMASHESSDGSMTISTAGGRAAIGTRVGDAKPCRPGDIRKRPSARAVKASLSQTSYLDGKGGGVQTAGPVGWGLYHASGWPSRANLQPYSVGVNG